MLDLLSQPWPWYVAGPLFGLLVPLLFLAVNRPLCAMALPGRAAFFRYGWPRAQRPH